MRNCYLLGFMGAGKSYIAQQLGHYTNRRVVDLDALIEAEAGKSIRRIFEEEGEAYFRTLETKLLYTTLRNAPQIVALGGGTPIYHNNMDWIKANGDSIFLDPPEAVLLERLAREQAKRPLIAELAPEKWQYQILKRLEARRPIYEQADLSIKAQSAALIVAACLTFLGE